MKEQFAEVAEKLSAKLADEQAIGGAQGLEFAKAFNPVVWEADPTPEVVDKALDVLTGRARVKRTMWSRRAQEYEAKINSGDLIAVAEVVRDLHRADSQPEQSYSERQLYEAALDRVTRELAHVNKITDTEATKLIEASLAKAPKRAKPGDAGEAEASDLQDEAA